MEEKIVRRRQRFKQTTSLNDSQLMLAREAEKRAASNHHASNGIASSKGARCKNYGRSRTVSWARKVFAGLRQNWPCDVFE